MLLASAAETTDRQCAAGIELRRFMVAACSTVTPMSRANVATFGSGHLAIKSATELIMGHSILNAQPIVKTNRIASIVTMREWNKIKNYEQ